MVQVSAGNEIRCVDHQQVSSPRGLAMLGGDGDDSGCRESRVRNYSPAKIASIWVKPRYLEQLTLSSPEKQRDYDCYRTNGCGMGFEGWCTEA